MNVLRRLWAGWTRVAHVIGNVQARLLLSLLDFVLLGPFAVGLRLRRTSGPGWLPRPAGEGDAVARGRKQF